VTIVDTTDGGTLQFETLQVSVPEHSMAASVAVVRKGGHKGAVYVGYLTQSDSAIAGAPRQARAHPLVESFLTGPFVCVIVCDLCWNSPAVK
jgi:hypothetical protein